jgi:MFS family permease
MKTPAEQILKTYVTLTLLSTFASSFIWGINTLFLLDAGLSITEAFAANAFFTVGQVLFEVPTGVIADTVGRRVSYLLGAATLFSSTILYLLLWHIHGPFWAWAVVSMLLGLGFTFFSGATEAWLVDGLNHTKHKGTLEAAFAKGQIATGVAMLSGTVAGGVIAQFTNLGVPYILRAVMLAITFIIAYLLMKDVGFTPRKSASVAKDMRTILKASLDHGLRNPPVRWVMLAAPFSAGVGFYAFYAMQPYLLQLYGRTDSYAIAGLAAAIVAGAQVIGGFTVPFVRKRFKRRTSVLLVGSILSAAALASIGLLANFWLALALLVVWAIVFAASIPIRQAYLNSLIPSAQRATVLSSDNLLGSSGGVVIQPGLGKVADVWGYGASYVVGAGIQLLALPFILFARQVHAAADNIEKE